MRVVHLEAASYHGIHHWLGSAFPLTSFRRHVASSWPVLLPIVGLVGLSAALFPSAGRDDAYITYWAANTLREFGEIANLNGVRLEQSTSLLHVLVLGAVSLASGASAPAVGTPLSVVFGVLTVVYTYQFACMFVGRWYAMGAGMIVATAAPFAYWTTGGLEGTMTALAATALLFHTTRYLERTGSGRPPASVWISVGAFLLARPEAALALGAVVLGMFVILRLRGISVSDERLENYAVMIRKVLWVGLAVVVLTAAIMAVKAAYFGGLLPQPVSAKLGGGALFSRAGDGALYIVTALLPPPISLLPFFSIAGAVYTARKVVRDEPEFAGALLLGLYAAAYLCFIFAVGGDWMEGSRFIVPVIPALALLAILVIPRIGSGDLRVYAVGGIVAFHIVGAIWFAKFGSVSTPLWDVYRLDTTGLPVERHSWFARPNRTHLRDMPAAVELTAVIERLQGEVEGKVTVMSGQAGFVPYHAIGPYYREVEFIDRRGVTTPHFTDCDVTRAAERTTTGMLLSFGAFFDNGGAIKERCGIARPHVIFDLDLPERTIEKAVVRNGYVVVYRQTGKIQTSEMLQGIEVLAHEFIAVRGDLARLFEGMLPKVREWGAR